MKTFLNLGIVFLGLGDIGLIWSNLTNRLFSLMPNSQVQYFDLFISLAYIGTFLGYLYYSSKCRELQYENRKLRELLATSANSN
jgi:hypothetical protein